jgi:hypothetical protein
VVLYGAHLDTHFLLFFQAVFMLPVFLLGCLLFLGIEKVIVTRSVYYLEGGKGEMTHSVCILLKESFNLVLYPSLMLLFLVLLRYGTELALMFIHWDDHPDFVLPFLFALDMTAIGVLMLYVYFNLASSLGNDQRHVNNAIGTGVNEQGQFLLR